MWSNLECVYTCGYAFVNCPWYLFVQMYWSWRCTTFGYIGLFQLLVKIACPRYALSQLWYSWGGYLPTSWLRRELIHYVELMVDKMTLVRLSVVAFSLFLPFIFPLMFTVFLNVSCVYLALFRFYNSPVPKFYLILMYGSMSSLSTGSGVSGNFTLNNRIIFCRFSTLQFFLLLLLSVDTEVLILF